VPSPALLQEGAGSHRCPTFEGGAEVRRPNTTPHCLALSVGRSQGLEALLPEFFLLFPDFLWPGSLGLRRKQPP
jgi:hypothetical protein